MAFLMAAALAATTITAAAQDGSPTGCPAATVTVTSAAELRTVLAGARPGDVIAIADGTYDGDWTARTSGSPVAPIWLCGGPGAVLTNTGHAAGYGLHLAGASWWHLYGFTVTRAKKGVMVDAAHHVTLDRLTVSEVDEEGIHLRTNTTDSLITGNRIHRTGRVHDQWGEGVYIGSAAQNWPTYTAGLPDRSDRNSVVGNVIHDTTAEPIDIKEGTTGGRVTGNSLDAAALTRAGGDSCGDVKGNGWSIVANHCFGSTADGWQTHSKRRAGVWGLGTEFAGNIVILAGSATGYGFKIEASAQATTTVRCDNVVHGVFANVPCTPSPPARPTVDLFLSLAGPWW
ncbi:hypothetical protein HII36_41150 [Nonomuraea sp. NN258]|uniref:right-handed parallel beta-helix repeat-containing protein n=1 Tax=Nonomuraea antri TaxID=2730852 RepID=UPI0015689314|nr:right-handed parallel beta-helix repeat-containing protein [Nonomuraea antri]NRQ38194.1 hypothetical protein [Nonomuraea antri]